MEDLGHLLPDFVKGVVFLDRVVGVLGLVAEVVDDVIDRTLPLGALDGILVLVALFREIEFEDGFHKRWDGVRDLPANELRRFISPLHDPHHWRRDTDRQHYHHVAAAGILAAVIIALGAGRALFGPMKGGECVCIDRAISAWSTDRMEASDTSSGATGRLS